MRKLIALLVVGAGGVAAAQSEDTRIDVQVSVDAQSWWSHVQAVPGQEVYSRLVVSYTGTRPVYGLSLLVVQPIVSDWRAGDALLPFVDNGSGSNTSRPELGVIGGPQLWDTTSFGRVSPFGARNVLATDPIFGHVDLNPDGSGLTYLRIALHSTTGWFGERGNTTGNMGVTIHQLNNTGRTASDPAFESGLNEVYAFKFGVRLGADESARDMTLDIPQAGIGRMEAGGPHQAAWYVTMTELTGSERGEVVVVPATIEVVPGPGALAVLLAGLAVMRRRRGARGDPARTRGPASAASSGTSGSARAIRRGRS